MSAYDRCDSRGAGRILGTLVLLLVLCDSVSGYRLPADTAVLNRLLLNYYMEGTGGLLVVAWQPEEDTAGIRYEALYSTDTNWYRPDAMCFLAQSMTALRVSKTRYREATLHDVHIGNDSATIIEARLEQPNEGGEGRIVLRSPRIESIENMPTGEITGQITIGPEKKPLRGVRAFVEQVLAEHTSDEAGTYRIACPMANDSLRLHVWGKGIDSVVVPVRKRHWRTTTVVDINYDQPAWGGEQTTEPVHRFLVTAQGWQAWLPTVRDGELLASVFHVTKGMEFYLGRDRFGVGKELLFKLMHIDKRGAWIRHSESLAPVRLKEISNTVKFGPEPAAFRTRTADAGTTYTVYLIDSLWGK